MPELEPINILIVDDSATNLIALETVLRGDNRNVVLASSGEDALRYLLENDAAVVLLDVYMPGIDGLQTAELIRGRDCSREIPIIFLTANNTGVRDLSRGYSLGAVDYIVKPVDSDILRSKVAVFVDLFRKNRQIEQQADQLREKNLELESANLNRLRMMINLGQELAAERDPAKVLERVCGATREILGAEEAAVGLLNVSTNTLDYFFCCASNGTPTRRSVPLAVQPAVDRLIAESRPLRLNDIEETHAASQSDPYLIFSFLGAPIPFPSSERGWFYILNKLDADEFSEADEQLAATLATQAAAAYENARLYTEAERHAAELRMEVAVRKQAEEERGHLLVREKAARMEAERANRAKDEFLAMLSHELRTPLTAILGWSHLLRENPLEGAQLTHALDTIERNAHSQSQLIDDLLDVSRIISGKFQIERSLVNLATAIDAAIDSAQPAIAAKKIDLHAEKEITAVVQGDANRLQQIFWNLLSNAVKFTPSGGRVGVVVTRNGSHVRVAITDTGIGIKPDFLPFIFERFRQADGSTTRSHGGLGLGLAIVRHLVELHNGKVEVQSDGKDLGATFTVSFPLASELLDGDRIGDDVEGYDSSFIDGQALKGLKILVVDDDADSRELVGVILSGCGAEVRCTQSASEAIDAYQDWNPDVLVSDIGMPGLDGYGLIEKLKDLSTGSERRLTALALTAYAADEDRASAIAAGFHAHISKPIEPRVLVSSIASALGRE